MHDGQLYVVDADDKTLIGFDLEHQTRYLIAADLPVGARPG
ncbi:hypothetical protein C1Y40_03879 [Mycobacterium talmoniae]|uniref:Uncharacterized protein n=1 Tax=Mycobacterium talmoniae TaxID=1858794 RepID=A0A2S8BGZ2_9MYCO|nr:hypothetical protein C1Y40_03879 [Mycobacterium talmoniae]